MIPSFVRRDERDSELRELPEFLLDFAEERHGDGRQLANESLIVDRAALVYHDFTFLPITSDATRQRNPQKVFSRQTRCTRQDPGGGMPGLVKQI